MPSLRGHQHKHTCIRLANKLRLYNQITVPQSDATHHESQADHVSFIRQRKKEYNENNDNPGKMLKERIILYRARQSIGASKLGIMQRKIH